MVVTLGTALARLQSIGRAGAASVATYIGVMVSHRSDVAVVGGGVIGLSSAFALARAGRSVVVFDDRKGRGASFAAAGMLAPGAESSPEHAALTVLALRSRALWPSLVAQLSEYGDDTAHVVNSGSLFVAWDATDRREMDRYFAIARQQGITATEVDRRQSPQCFEGLTSRVNSGTFVPNDAYIEPDAVMRTLHHALEELEVRFVAERAECCDVVNDEGVAVTTSADRYVARSGVIATGATPRPLALLQQSSQRVRPVRGVTLRLHGPEGVERPMIRGYVQGRQIYVISHRDGTIIVGASSDESADETVESGTVRRLLEDATLLVPDLDHSMFVEARVGLRPASRDNLPFFEPLGSTSWAWSSGHFRHGFLLAPLAALSAVEFVAERLS